MRALKLNVHKTTEQAITAAARLIADLVAIRPNAVLGLATGGTMEPLYTRLVEFHRAGLSFRRVRTVNLDEYVGLAPDHPNSYHSYMQRHFFDHVDIPEDAIHIPRGDVEPDRAAAEYSALLDRVGPVDLQLLGIGANGHIGFNEPGTPVNAPTRVVDLLPDTISANARFFTAEEQVPSQAVTMGTAAILAARSVLALATGPAKAESLAAALDGAISPDCPASYLRLHPSCTIIADRTAGARLGTLKALGAAA
ncbi:glucosamine-6-phosphate deaminase [Paracoccus sp. NGMCC 1.201697]|uniref:Glucosamine-6-phosphate deaminase n=1 Tax=Paracoccus broussonetiae subsp. drimophilus TaxID=3373869 RepID=A0ABW7LQJ2_9RHOB